MNWIGKCPAIVLLLVLCHLAASAQSDQPVSRVDSIASLEKLAAGAKPGTTLVLAAGRYDGPCAIKGLGTAEHPIIVKAESIGKVELHDKVEISGEYVALVGFKLSGKGSLSLKGRGLRISRCTVSDARADKWITCTPDSRLLEIDHCLFENKTINREKRGGCQLIRFVVKNDSERHHIHHNHFRDIPKGGSGNGFETIQLITRGNPFDPPEKPCGSRIEYNLFERCNGEPEIISVKSSGNIIRGNVFRESRGSLVLRHGHGNQAIGNFFFGDGEKGAGGVRLQGRNQVVVNNYFQDLNFGVGMMDGTPDKLYVRVEDALVAHNSFINCRKGLHVGINHSKHPNGTVPRCCTIANNLFYIPAEAGDETGTGQAVELVQGDQPEVWDWVGNRAQGTPGIPTRDGFSVGMLNLGVVENGMALPSTKTPTANRRDAKEVNLALDIFGRRRPQQATLGAIQFTGKEVSADEVMLAEPVGPQ